MPKNTSIGINAAKNSFYLSVLNQPGKICGKKKLSREQTLKYLTQQSQRMMTMEDSASFHYRGARNKQARPRSENILVQHAKGYLRVKKWL
ncbi:MAG: hypothetical protein OIF55_18205 [Amphritea sp.]|nr:hypothetical protein [Amphritea sp.]